MTNAETAPQKKSRMAFPLPAKILACFLLNLALIAAAALYVAQGQFGFGADSLLTGSSGARVQTLSALAVSELNKSPRAEWPAVLKRIADAYEVQIAAVLNDGSRLAGTISDPPPPVLRKLAEGSGDRQRPLPPELRGPRDRPEGSSVPRLRRTARHATGCPANRGAIFLRGPERMASRGHSTPRIHCTPPTNCRPAAIRSARRARDARRLSPRDARLCPSSRRAMALRRSCPAAGRTAFRNSSSARANRRSTGSACARR